MRRPLLVLVLGALCLSAVPAAAQSPPPVPSVSFLGGLATSHTFPLPGGLIGIAFRNDLGDYVIQFIDGTGKPTVVDFFGPPAVVAYTLVLTRTEQGTSFYDVWGSTDGRTWAFVRSLP
jgi:hypothetical protein